ncbi:MAG: hypothetical protein R3E83_06645 [Burkholderiaceae bacterium]
MPARSSPSSLLDDANGSFILEATDGTLHISAQPTIGASAARAITIVVTDSAGHQLAREFTLQLIEVDAGTSSSTPTKGPAPARESSPTSAQAPDASATSAQPIAESVEPTPLLQSAANEKITVQTLQTEDEAPTIQAHSEQTKLVERDARSAPRRATDGPQTEAAAAAAPSRFANEISLDLQAIAPQGLAGDFLDWVLERQAIRRGDVQFSVDQAQLAEQTGKQGDELTIRIDPLHATGAIVGSAALWWVARAGGILTSLLIGAPTWRSIDPLPIAMRSPDVDRDPTPHDDESHLPLPGA